MPRWTAWDGKCRRCNGDGPFRPQTRTCMPCEAAKVRQAYRDGGEAARETARTEARLRRERNPDAVRASTNRNVARYRERHHDRLAQERREREASPEYRARYHRAHLARNTVQDAVRTGRLVRPDTCEQCRGHGPIEGAHADYSEPLEIRWLCWPCHRRWDAVSPKTKKVQNSDSV